MGFIRVVLRPILGLAGVVSTVWFYVAAVGAAPWVISLLVGATATVGGILEGLSITIVAVAAWLTMCVTFLVVATLRRSRDITPNAETSSAPQPAYEAWDHVNEFTIFQAAHLWADQEPGRKLSRGSVKGYFQMLVEAVDRDKLRLEMKEFGYSGRIIVGASTIIHRDSLRDFAREKNMRPRFLFPEDAKN